jgi:tight adherence protein B
MPASETLLLALATLVIVLLVVDLARDELRDRRDRKHLDRMGDRLEARRAEREDDEAGRRPLGAVERRLRAAGLPIGGPTFFAGSVLLGALAATGLYALLPTVLVAPVAGGLLAAYLPWLAVGAVARTRAHRFEARLADALGFMVGSLQAGENPLHAFSSAAEASDGAVRREFREVAHRLQAGMDIRRALRRIVEGYDAEGVLLFATTLTAKWRVGGDLVPILESVARVVRERIRVRMRLRSHLAGARVAAVAVALLPYTVIPIFQWQLPQMIDRLVEHPLGPTLVAVAVLLQIVGWLWLVRILRIEL